MSVIKKSPGTHVVSPVEEIQRVLAREFSDIETVFRKADDPNGFQFLNIYLGELEVAVEWKADIGFGLSSFQSDGDGLEGAFDKPDEWYTKTASVIHRIQSLLIEGQATKPKQMRIREIRREFEISQEELSEVLGVTQATYSKQERRADIKLSTLRRLIEGMGGILRIEARFPDSQSVREVTF